MKRIGAKSTSGPEAIIVALIAWWRSHHPTFEHRIQEVFAANRSKFEAKSQAKLGKVFEECAAPVVKELIIEFMSSTQSNPLGKYAMERAVLEHSILGTRENVDWARGFVRKSILSLIGFQILQLKAERS